MLAIALAVIVFIVAPEWERRQQAEQHYQAGVAFQEVGDWDQAVEAFEKVVAIDATYNDARARLAEVRAKQQEAQATSVAATATAQIKATVEAQQAKATATAETLAKLEEHYQKGLGYINLEEWVEAKAELEQVFEEEPNYKEVQAKLTEVETEVAKLIPTATPIPPTPEIIELKPDYDRGWRADNRSTNHRTVFTHDLGIVPSRVTILFSPTAPHRTVYPLLWSWTATFSGNPVTVELSATQLVLDIWSGAPLHGIWRGDLGQWTYYDSGYWRVLLWR
jgi:tetratricopeptide (TPR) repeat protein